MNDAHRERQSAKRSWQMFLLRGIVPWWRMPSEDRSTLRDLLYLRWVAWSLGVTIVAIVVLLGGTVTPLVERLYGQRPHDPATYLPFAAVLTAVVPIALVILIWSIIRRRARRKRGLVVDHRDH
ncbi:MAG: hypothetical protein ABFD96_09290 [Armatimonadia bacterium]